MLHHPRASNGQEQEIARPQISEDGIKMGRNTEILKKDDKIRKDITDCLNKNNEETNIALGFKTPTDTGGKK